MTYIHRVEHPSVPKDLTEISLADAIVVEVDNLFNSLRIHEGMRQLEEFAISFEIPASKLDLVYEEYVYQMLDKYLYNEAFLIASAIVSLKIKQHVALELLFYQVDKTPTAELDALKVARVHQISALFKTSKFQSALCCRATLEFYEKGDKATAEAMYGFITEEKYKSLCLSKQVEWEALKQFDSALIQMKFDEAFKRLKFLKEKMVPLLSWCTTLILENRKDLIDIEQIKGLVEINAFYVELANKCDELGLTAEANHYASRVSGDLSKFI